jgi:hypothetical protein
MLTKVIQEKSVVILRKGGDKEGKMDGMEIPTD